jgi:hypothetical protein
LLSERKLSAQAHFHTIAGFHVPTISEGQMADRNDGHKKEKVAVSIKPEIKLRE